MITRYGMNPGVKSGENEIHAEARQIDYYGEYAAHRIFFPFTLMGQENGSAQRARQLILEMNPDEDLIVSCKTVGPEFAARTAELKVLRDGKGLTLLIIDHEPEGDVTVAGYNVKWNAALFTLRAEESWLWPGTCHTGFWSRSVNASGVRVNDWRQWIPNNPVVQKLLRFVSVDLYPSAGRPTKAKPKYYEPPTAHPSPYGNWTEIGFCGILDEMLNELRGDKWPNIRTNLHGGIAEMNHGRPTITDGWPIGFANSDVDGERNADWLNSVLTYANDRYLFVTYFHKGGGILTDREPPVEAETLRAWIRDTYDANEGDPRNLQYKIGYAAGWAAREATARVEIDAASERGHQRGETEVARRVQGIISPYLPTT